MTRFLQTWLVAYFVLTLLIGVVTSWQSTTLTLQLGKAIAPAFVLALAFAGFRK